MKQNSILIPLGFAVVVAAASAWAPPACAESEPSKTHYVGIGAGEGKLSHLDFDIKEGAKIVQVSTHLIVDKVSSKGLNFFAIQVDFPNKTWAHGGPQINKEAGGLVQYANWGGLVDRGGGNKDYDEANEKKDIYLIECGIGKPNTVPWKWMLNCEYVLTIVRGKQVDLPAGGGHGGNHNVHVGKRTMWEWKFTITPLEKDKSKPAFTSLLYDSADHIASFCVWNEAGYGSTGKEQHARWSLPTYHTDGDTHRHSIQKYTRD